MRHSRYHLDIGANAAVSVIEHFISRMSNPPISPGADDRNRGENSDFRHLKLGFENPQAYHFAHNDLVIAAHAVWKAPVSCSAAN